MSSTNQEGPDKPEVSLNRFQALKGGHLKEQSSPEAISKPGPSKIDVPAPHQPKSEAPPQNEARPVAPRPSMPFQRGP